VDEKRATQLLADERENIERLLRVEVQAGRQDRSGADEPGDMTDPSQPLVDEGLDDAVEESLRARLASIERAEARLRDGTYGRSVRSGVKIPDERLEADPAAELTVEEAEEDSRR
jgi:DnaK suppressor protein